MGLSQLQNPLRSVERDLTNERAWRHADGLGGFFHAPDLALIGVSRGDDGCHPVTPDRWTFEPLIYPQSLSSVKGSSAGQGLAQQGDNR